ncbi:MAG: DUF2513 domain-containing protein [Pseudorhodobacter sp.]|nr:DUF2513 domain-containing protein [Pseudorhodobacter sp.]
MAKRDLDRMITFDGHDYLDAIRDEGIWQKTKKAVVDTGGNATVEILNACAWFLEAKDRKTHRHRSVV